MQLKIAAYLRVSTEEQAQLVEGSLDSQKYRISEFVKARCAEKSDWGKIVDFYIDDGYSAKDTKRPAYQRMMTDIRKGKVNLILVADLSRLSRNILDFSNLLDFLDKWKAKFLSMKEQFDTSTPAGKMMVFNMINLAQFEREQTSERVALNAHARAMRGLLNGGRAIMGYKRDPDKPGTLIVNEDESSVVKTIFKTFLECGDRAKTCKQLHEMQIFPKGDSESGHGRKSAKWNVNTLGRLLNQTAYIGHKEVNRGNKDADPNGLKPWQKYQVVKATWPSIISEDLFYSVQKVLAEQGTISIARKANGETRSFLLSGVLSCGSCGNPLMGHTSHGARSKHRYYVHSTFNNHHGCEVQRYRADELEDSVVDHLLKFGLDNAGYLKRLETTFNSVTKNERQGVGAEKKRVHDALKSLEQKIATMWRVQMEGTLNAEALKMVSEEMNQLAGEKRDLLTYSAALEEKSGVIGDVEERMDFLGDRLDELVRGWKKASAFKQKLLLKRALLGVVVSAEETKIIYLNSREQELGLASGGGAELKAWADGTEDNLNVITPDTKKPSRDEKVLSSFRIKNGRSYSNPINSNS